MSEKKDSGNKPNSGTLKNESEKDKSSHLGIVLANFISAFLYLWESKREDSTDKKEQRADEHLIAAATKKMARYTGFLVVATVASVVTAIATVRILVVQINQTEKAFRMDERAWIELEEIKQNTIVPDKAGAIILYDFFLKNVGKTAAYDITVRASSFDAPIAMNNVKMIKIIMDGSLRTGFKNPKSGKVTPIPIEIVPKVLAPGSRTPTPFQMSGATPDKWAGGISAASFLIGEIDYTDTFRDPHWLSYCFIVGGDQQLHNCAGGNDADRDH